MGMGTGKKNPGKFTLQFNMMDPAHREVAELLDSMGRMKAQFLTNAVQYYRYHSENPGAPAAAPMPVDYALLESIVRRILAEKEPEPAAPSAAAAEPLPQKRRLRQSEDIYLDEATELLGEENMAAISKAVAAFRRK